MAVLDLGVGVGPLLREWRERQRLSQLALALNSGISARHLSFIETGRSKPGRDVLLRLTECLEVPLREQNELLLVSGYAPAFPELPLQDSMLAPVREALDVIIGGHEPYPAVVVDRYWNLVAASTVMVLVAQVVDSSLLEPPINAMRTGLHPRGLAGPLDHQPGRSARLLPRASGTPSGDYRRPEACRPVGGSGQLRGS
jgi:transcriptional regulator with XRE-family HTH domain